MTGLSVPTPLRVLLGISFLGWMVEAITQPVLPLVIFDRGGTASVVGIAATIYSVPSLLARPPIGRIIDSHGYSGIHKSGAAMMALAPIIYVAPWIATLLVGRLFQGTGWAFYSTANNVMLADIAPPSRRSEMSGYVTSMRALALLVGPPMAIWALGKGEFVVFALASSFGAMAAIGAFLWHRRGPSRLRDAPDTMGTVRRRWLEPSAVAPMVMLATFVVSQSLFLVFAPVYVQVNGLHVGVLAVFYPLYGITLVVAPMFVARISDRVGRQRATAHGCLATIVGLGIAALPLGIVGFTLGAMAVAGSSSMVTSSLSAATMDRAPNGRLGAAMATFSMGYQLAAGVGGALWGVVIDIAGFPWPFGIAVVGQAATLLIARKSLRD